MQSYHPYIRRSFQLGKQPRTCMVPLHASRSPPSVVCRQRHLLQSSKRTDGSLSPFCIKSMRRQAAEAVAGHGSPAASRTTRFFSRSGPGWSAAASLWLRWLSSEFEALAARRLVGISGWNSSTCSRVREEGTSSFSDTVLVTQHNSFIKVSSSR